MVAINRNTGEAFKTTKYWSRTTSKHIGQYFRDVVHAPEGAIIEGKPQEFFDGLMAEVK